MQGDVDIGDDDWEYIPPIIHPPPSVSTTAYPFSSAVTTSSKVFCQAGAPTMKPAFYPTVFPTASVYEQVSFTVTQVKQIPFFFWFLVFGFWFLVSGFWFLVFALYFFQLINIKHQTNLVPCLLFYSQVIDGIDSATYMSSTMNAYVLVTTIASVMTGVPSSAVINVQVSSQQHFLLLIARCYSRRLETQQT